MPGGSSKEMGHKKKKKRAHKLRRDLALYLALRGLLSLPYHAYRAVTAGMFNLGLLFSNDLQRMEQLVTANLNHLFPQKKPREKRRLFRRITGRLLGNFYEIQKFHSQRWVKKTVSVEGEDLLKEALAEKKGVICLSAHLGNFPLLLAYFSQRGYPVNTINRKLHNRFLEKYAERIKQRAKIAIIPKHPTAAAIRDSLRWLEKGGLLFILADQHTDRGIIAPLFNHPVKVPTGPAMLARRAGCPVLPVSIRRCGRKHLVRIEPPLALHRNGDFLEDIRKNTALFNQVLERWVRETPLEWSSWFNKRFPPLENEN